MPTSCSDDPPPEARSLRIRTASADFHHDEKQRRLIEESLRELEKSKPFREKIVAQVAPASDFRPAEMYHQQYDKKNPLRYRFYRSGCGRDERLKQRWGKQGSSFPSSCGIIGGDVFSSRDPGSGAWGFWSLGRWRSTASGRRSARWIG